MNRLLQELLEVCGELGVRALLSPAARRELDARVQWETDVVRVCCVYPYRVPLHVMSKALELTCRSPAQIYEKLAAGEMIPALDILLLEWCEPW